MRGFKELRERITRARSTRRFRRDVARLFDVPEHLLGSWPLALDRQYVQMLADFTDHAESIGRIQGDSASFQRAYLDAATAASPALNPGAAFECVDERHGLPCSHRKEVFTMRGVVEHRALHADGLGRPYWTVAQ